MADEKADKVGGNADITADRESQALLVAGHAEWAGDLEHATRMFSVAAGGSGDEMGAPLETDEARRDEGRSKSHWKPTDFLRLAALRRYGNAANLRQQASERGQIPQPADHLSDSSGQDADRALLDDANSEYDAEPPALINEEQLRGVVRRLAPFEFETRAYALTASAALALVTGAKRRRFRHSTASRNVAGYATMESSLLQHSSGTDVSTSDSHMTHLATVTMPGLVNVRTIWFSPEVARLAAVVDSSRQLLLSFLREGVVGPGV